LSIHCCRLILTNKFNRINAIRLDRCQSYFAKAFNAFNTSMVIKAVHICIHTALGVVPMKDLMWSSCLISLKKISTCQRLLYSSLIVLADHLRLLVMSSMTQLCSSLHTDTLLSLPL